MGNPNMMKDIVVIDIESTGVDTDTNEIIGISSVLLQSQKVTGFKYETWCNAPKDFDKEALKIIGKKIRPTNKEISENRRARSALLRIAERM